MIARFFSRSRGTPSIQFLIAPRARSWSTASASPSPSASSGSLHWLINTSSSGVVRMGLRLIHDLHGRDERDHERDGDATLAAPLKDRCAPPMTATTRSANGHAAPNFAASAASAIGALARVPGRRVGAGPSHEGAELPRRGGGARRVRRAHRERERERYEKHDEGPVDREKNQGQRERQQYHVREDVEARVARDARGGAAAAARSV